MKKAKNLHNLDSLEREIYRLTLEAKNIEEKLDNNLAHLEENFSSITMNSFFGKKKNRENEQASFFTSLLKNEKLTTVVDKITDRIADRAAEGIDKLLDKMFHKKKHHSE
jgi:hypothetical protein